MELHELVHEFNQIRRLLMTIEDQVIALTSLTQQIASDVAALKNTVQTPTIDLTPVTTAIAALQADVDAGFTAVEVNFQATPAPVPAQ